MPSQNPKKVHYVALSDRVSKCGRSIELDYPRTTDMSKVTCYHCLTPNRPFSITGRPR